MPISRRMAVVNGAVSAMDVQRRCEQLHDSRSAAARSTETLNPVSYDGSADGKKASGFHYRRRRSTVRLVQTLYNPDTSHSTGTDDVTKATIEVTGGTFTDDPTKVCDRGTLPLPRTADGTFGVEKAKAYLAKVGETFYYTMEEAFKAQTAERRSNCSAPRLYTPVQTPLIPAASTARWT